MRITINSNKIAVKFVTTELKGQNIKCKINETNPKEQNKLIKITESTYSDKQTNIISTNQNIKYQEK